MRENAARDNTQDAARDRLFRDYLEARGRFPDYFGRWIRVGGRLIPDDGRADAERWNNSELEVMRTKLEIARMR